MCINIYKRAVIVVCSLLAVVLMMWYSVHVWGTHSTTIHPISNVYFLFSASWWKAMLIYKECKNGRSILLHVFFSFYIASVAYSFGVATYDCALCIPCIFIKAFTISHIISKSIGVHAANNRIFFLFLCLLILPCCNISLARISLSVHIFFWLALETISFWSICFTVQW